MAYLEIEKVVGREILDSRGNPHVREGCSLHAVRVAAYEISTN